MIRSQDPVVFPNVDKKVVYQILGIFCVSCKTAGINYQTTVILFEQGFWYSSVELKDITCKFFLLMQR